MERRTELGSVEQGLLYMLEDSAPPSREHEDGRGENR